MDSSGVYNVAVNNTEKRLEKSKSLAYERNFKQTEQEGKVMGPEK